MAKSKAFDPLFEVFCLTVAFMISLRTSRSFLTEYFTRDRGFYNLMGLTASILTLFFTTWALTLWFTGIEGLNCVTIQVVTGMCLSSSTALVFMHLFLKINASCKLHSRWQLWKIIGISTIALNWLALIAVHALMTAHAEPNFILDDEDRCVYKYEDITIRLKLAIQLITHGFLVYLFISPIFELMHVIHYNRSAGSCDINEQDRESEKFKVYNSLFIKTISGFIISTLFTAGVTGVMLLGCQEKQVIEPAFAFLVLDNGIRLISIYLSIEVAGSGGQILSSDIQLNLLNSRTVPSNHGNGRQSPAIT